MYSLTRHVVRHMTGHGRVDLVVRPTVRPTLHRLMKCSLTYGLKCCVLKSKTSVRVH